MCIRDRASRADCPDRARDEATTTSPAVSQPARNRSRGLLCLLYTSDAADERSSVDLGGRRIIKKKKYTERCGVGVSIILDT